MINFKKMSNITILGVCALCTVFVFEHLQVHARSTRIETQETVHDASEPPPGLQSDNLTNDPENDHENVYKVAYKKTDDFTVGSNKEQTLKKLRHHCHLAALHPGVPSNPTVQKYVRQFTQAKSEKTWETKPEVKSQLNYIIQQLEKRDLPGELALLPMVESNFKTTAKSHKGAVGLWQFMPKTGRSLGLKCKGAYDGRKDVKASTHAALNYLEYLHKRFNQDWMLALAAYNAGEGTVSKAMNRNKRQGKGTSFWALKLPYETTQYVPKMLGLIQYVKQLN